MSIVIPIIVCITFITLALWHFKMAFGPVSGTSGSVPFVDGKPLFVPSRGATIAVGAVLLLFALLVAVTGRVIPLVLPRVVLTWLSYGLALGLLARAIGEFKYVGFFKRVRGSRFATLDTLLFSPLCLLLALAVAFVALENRAGA